MPEGNSATLSFTCDFDQKTEWEIEQKCWFAQALVHLPDGATVPVCFWDPVRLAQDLEADLRSGKTCVAEPGMIVVPKVTVEKMKAAVEELYHRGFFESLRDLAR